MENDVYYISELEDKILDTIYRNMKYVQRPFGCLFSGGFDSGLLAAITHPDYIFRVKFPYGVQYDESRYSDAIIKHLGLQNVIDITITKELFNENFIDAVQTMGEPTTHFSLVPLYILMKEVAKHCKIVISGEGPDEYLGGYARYIIFDELKKMYRIPELRNYHPTINKALGIARDDFLRVYGNMMGYKPLDIARHDHEQYPMLGSFGKMDMDLGCIEKMEQKMAKNYDINLIYPYITNEFAEYCYRLPDNLKVRDGVTKWAFRQICKKYLPEFVMERSKMGGPVAPVNEWLGVEDIFNKATYIKKQKEILGLI